MYTFWLYYNFRPFYFKRNLNKMSRRLWTRVTQACWFHYTIFDTLGAHVLYYRRAVQQQSVSQSVAKISAPLSQFSGRKSFSPRRLDVISLARLLCQVSTVHARCHRASERVRARGRRACVCAAALFKGRCQPTPITLPSSPLRYFSFLFRARITFAAVEAWCCWREKRERERTPLWHGSVSLSPARQEEAKE